MTFPTFVATATVSGSQATAVTISYPATVLAGELILLIGSNDGGGADFPTLNPIGSWTELVAPANAGSSGHSIYWLDAVGTEDGGTENFDIASAEGTTASMIRIADWDNISPPEISARGTGTADDWEAVSAFNPSWDSNTIDTLWIAGISGIDNGGNGGIAAFPTGYNDNQAHDTSSVSTAFASHGYGTQATLATSLSSDAKFATLSQNGTHFTWIMAIRGVSAGGLSIPVAMHHHLQHNLS